MPSTPLDTHQQRAKTDEHLQAERHKGDRLRADHHADVVASEERVLERARQQAEALLGRARDREDAHGAGAGASRVQERAAEDAQLLQEQHAADLDRARARVTLDAFGTLDREKTDLGLIAERARSDDALARRDDFMGMVSHDLRNLLNNIVLNASALADEASDSDEGRRTIHTMGRITLSVGRMSRLIGDLVDIASIDSGKLSVRCDSRDLVVIAQEGVDLLAKVATRKGVALTEHMPAHPLPVWCDEGRVLQVLTNLINNALKFTPPGGAVDVGVSGDSEAVTITVRDTGIGIAPEKLESVFQRFAQVADHDKRGLGLGLYISRCIVDHHHGRIWATSVFGEGSTFHVRLPAAAVGRLAA